MDAEGLGRKLLLTPLGDPRRTPETLTDSISQNANPASTFELSQCRHCKERLRLLGDLRQSVPQNGRVHLHIEDGTRAQQKKSGTTVPKNRSDGAKNGTTALMCCFAPFCAKSSGPILVKFYPYSCFLLDSLVSFHLI